MKPGFFDGTIKGFSKETTMGTNFSLPPRESDGKLPSYAWPGGYPMFYLDGHDSTLCAGCATKSADDADEDAKNKPCACDVYYEGPSMFCDQCNAEIESAYGDPEEDEA